MRRQAIHSALIAAAMIACSAVAAFSKPARVDAVDPGFKLEEQFPPSFGNWRADPDRPLTIVNPEMQRTIDELYDQTLDRVYVDSNGDRVMLSVAYGREQSEEKAMHRPEICYPSQGFKVRGSEREEIALSGMVLPVVRMRTDYGPRFEPLTYWMVVDEHAVNSPLGQKLKQTGAMFRGRIPDGMLVRVSTITPDAESGYATQARFIRDLYEAVPASHRPKIFGR